VFHVKGLVYRGTKQVAIEDVPDAKVQGPLDAVIRLTTTNICGSDLHMYEGRTAVEQGTVLGHENMGIVEEVGPAVDKSKLKVGDRVVVPFPIGCGNCFFCRRGLWSCCDNTNPKAYMAEEMFGFSTAGMFGYSHLTGG